MDIKDDAYALATLQAGIPVPFVPSPNSSGGVLTLFDLLFISCFIPSLRGLFFLHFCGQKFPFLTTKVIPVLC